MRDSYGRFAARENELRIERFSHVRAWSLQKVGHVDQSLVDCFVQQLGVSFAAGPVGHHDVEP